MIHAGNGLHCSAANFIDLSSLIVSRGQQRNSRLFGRIDHVVVDLLVVKVETKLRLKVIARFFQNHRLRRNEGDGIPVQVNVQCIPPLESVSPIGIEHGDKFELQLGVEQLSDRIV